MSDENQNGVRHFPLDVTRLVKGQVLKIDELEPIIGLKYPNPEWSLRVLQLRNRIEVQRSRQGLTVLTMRYRHGNLVVCDDSDAADYNRSIGKRGLRKFGRASARNMAVDMTKLDDEQRMAHTRTLQRQAMLLCAIHSAQHRKVGELTGPAERTTPKMITAET